MGKLATVYKAQRDGADVKIIVKPGLPEETLERAANELLVASLAVLGRGDHPFYSEAYLRNRDKWWGKRVPMAEAEEAGTDE